MASENQEGPVRQRKALNTFAALGMAAVVVVIVLAVFRRPTYEVSRNRPSSSNNLKQLVWAMHNYEGVHHRLPPAAIFGKDGEPLLSWRVLILPYLEQGPGGLFERFRLDEPWDSPHNIELLDEMPKVYAIVPRPHSPPKAQPEKRHTYMQAFVGKGSAFEEMKGCRFEDFPDGLSNTILLVEGGQPVPWTKPQDIPFDSDKPLPALSTVWEGGFLAGYADASVHFIKDNTPEKTIRALITRNGGEKIPNFD